MKKIIINGDFLCRTMTGIERYAFEITKRLDKLTAYHEIAIIVPSNTKYIPEYKNLLVIKHRAVYRSHIYWQMISLQCFLLLNRKYVLLEYANTCLPFVPCIVFLHDIYCALYPKDFVTVREKLARLYNIFQYKLILKKAIAVFTVSNFCKMQILRIFGTNADSLNVVYNSFEHFLDIEPDDKILSKFPLLNTKPFYFSLGSLSKRKNLTWIIKYAANHSDDLFVISGTNIALFKVKELNEAALPKNILLTGYISDSQVKALMLRCKAFLFISYYEGFGIPPLEALSCGAKVVAANAASLPEICGNSAYYIDPFDTDIELDNLLMSSVEPPEAALKKFSWDLSAEKLYNFIKDKRL